MNRTTRRAIDRAHSLIFVVGLCLALGGCETTTQRCMKEREACVEACEGKDRKNDCTRACKEALDKCMAH